MELLIILNPMARGGFKNIKKKIQILKTDNEIKKKNLIISQKVKYSNFYKCNNKFNFLEGLLSVPG